MEGHVAHDEGPQLRECRTILPHTTQMGKPVDPSVQKWLEAELVKQFGGFTAHSSWGACIMADKSIKQEGGITYDVALRENSYNKLVLLALGILRRADQETVYIRDPFGRVFIGSTAAQLTGGWIG
jgi:hypothetical protein